MKPPTDALLALDHDIARAYDEGHDLPRADEQEAYARRHGIRSLGILTVTRWEEAVRLAKKAHGAIRGKRVIEIGAGVGLLSMALARHAKSIVAIEADPAWSHAFTANLYFHKPKNMTWIFGCAEQVAPWLRGDVAVIATRSGHAAMTAVAKQMAPHVFHFHPRRENPAPPEVDFLDALLAALAGVPG